MGKITLEGMTFFANHGVTDEEQKTGNRYTVDVALTTDFLSAAEADLIDNTIDYEKVYIIVHQIMKGNARLLEALALRIINALKESFDQLEKVNVKVSKHNPPINGVCEKATVELEL